MFNFFKKEKIKKQNPYLADVKWAMREFFDVNEITPHSCQIHFIETEEKNDLLLVTVTLGRPGYFIGKAGWQIDAMKEYVEKYTQRTIEFKLVEYDVWR